MIWSTVYVKCDNCKKSFGMDMGALVHSYWSGVVNRSEALERNWLNQTAVSISDLVDDYLKRPGCHWKLRVNISPEPEKFSDLRDYCNPFCISQAKRKRAISGEPKPLTAAEITQSEVAEAIAEERISQTEFMEAQLAGKISYEAAWLKRNFPLDQPLPAGVRTRIALTREGRDALEARDQAIEKQRQLEEIEERRRNAFYALAPYGPGEEVPKVVREDLYCTAEGRAALIKHDEQMQVLRATRDALRGPNWRSVLTWFGGRR